MGADVHRDLADLRREYRSRPLRRDDLDADPLRQFDLWFKEALDVEAMDANAMMLATASAAGQPSLRTVLLKYYDENGFVFYTNLASRKADEIAENPQVALLFYWHELHRQVEVVGRAERISTIESAKYFHRRPRESQIGAWVSRQSHPISSRQLLEQKFMEIKAKFAKGEVPLPSFWGGYRVVPESIEFWQGRERRLHDRFRYRQAASGWEPERLAP
ncbi:MAG: pyridoxamine 5'-phosphate oxidase [Planctomycetota bacterium]|jgi:pyridoxamine 5'-phosphate oxidase